MTESCLTSPGGDNFPPSAIDSSRDNSEHIGSRITATNVVNLLLKGKKGSQDDFQRVAMPHLSYVYTAAYYLTKNQQDAEDLTQDTFIRAFRFFKRFEPGTNCRAWLLAIQRHLFINRYRQKKKQPDYIDWDRVDHEYDSLVLSEEHIDKFNPERILCWQAMAPEIEHALRSLPEEFRQVVILVDINELTYDEAAAILDCPLGTVRSRLSRGRRLLQVALSGYVRENRIGAKKL